MDTTLSGSNTTYSDRSPETPPVMSLTLIASIAEPERVGEIFIIPPVARFEEVVIGRGEASGGECRLLMARQRAGVMEHTGPLRDPRISRKQMGVRLESDGSLAIVQMGQCPLRINGVSVNRGKLRVGDIVEFERRSAFLCELRPAWLEPIDGYPFFDFGEPDEFGIVGEAPITWELRRQLINVARRSGHVLVIGPSGSGKELAARALHAMSSRKARKLVARNAVTIPESLADAELFGNVRNYPNASMPARPGLVGEADGGTLFLDEFAELPVTIQAHLLRVLDAGEHQPLGATQSVRADFRLIAATNRTEYSLRHDLAARFTWRLSVPSLNERRADIPLIARYLLRQLDPDCDPKQILNPSWLQAQVLREYQTNARQVRQALAAALSPSAQSGAASPLRNVTVEPTEPEQTVESGLSELVEPLQEYSAASIQAVLDRCNGSQTQAYRELGLTSRHALARLVRKYGVQIRRKY